MGKLTIDKSGKMLFSDRKSPLGCANIEKRYCSEWCPLWELWPVMGKFHRARPNEGY